MILENAGRRRRVPRGSGRIKSQDAPPMTLQECTMEGISHDRMVQITIFVLGQR